MPLSVSTSPADSTLASTLLGGVPTCAPASDEGTTPFASLFPGLASTPAADAAMAPGGIAPAVTPDATAESGPTWIGSTLPQAVSTQAPVRPPVAPLDACDRSVIAQDDLRVATAVAEAPVEGGTAGTTGPKAPTSPRANAAPRGTQRKPELPAPAVNPVLAECQPALTSVAQPQPPVVAPLTETALSPAPDSDSALSSEVDSAPAFSAAVPSNATLVPTVPGTLPAPVPVVPATGEPSSSTTESPAGQPVSAFPSTTRAIASRRSPAAQASEPSALADRGGRRAGPWPISAAPDAGEVTVAPVDGTEPPLPAAEGVAPNTFAPAEILSRQFAPSTRPAVTTDTPRLISESRAFTFASPAPAVALAPENGLSPEALTLTPNAPVATSPETAPALETTVGSSELAVAQLPAMAVAPRGSTPSARAEKPSSGRGAKIAADGRYFPAEKNSEHISSDKNFLTASPQGVASSDPAVGTRVAKSDATMPAAPFNPTAPAAVHDHVPVQSLSVASADRSSDFSSASVLTPEGADSAHRAVEAVLTAVDRFSTGDRHSVNLAFSVGGADLHVRVELRGDAVQTTFRTDSPELRTALAHEWQAANGQDTGERSLRTATPVFTSNSNPSESSNLSSFAGGDGSSRQRDPGARQTDGGSFDVAATRLRGTRSTAPAGLTEAGSISARPASPSSPRRLLAHA